MTASSSSGGGVAANNEGPIKGKNQFRGVLFKYGPKSIQVAFKTGDYKQQVIFIGGLTDGFLATKYLEPLAIVLDNEKWSLVQLLMSSSYNGYGTSSLQQFCLKQVYVPCLYSVPCCVTQTSRYCSPFLRCSCIICLEGCHGARSAYQLSNQQRKFRGCGYWLSGYSALYAHKCSLFPRSPCCHFVALVILPNLNVQAPVSDREYRATLPETAAMIDLASSMIKEGRGSDLMPKEADPCAPITAYRYNSLCAYMGDDDLFSSDLNDHQLRMRLGHMSNTPCQVIFSMDDEYVPEYVDKKALVERLCRAMGGAERVEVEHGTHSLSNRVHEAVNAVIDFVKREGPKGWDDPWS
ncbi:hypothetical protein V6N13_012871 [Hibiscus sabdariffa]